MIYTKDIVADITAAYLADENCVPALCDKYSCSSRSMIAKLSALGIYKRKVYKTKQGTAVVPKAALIEKLSELTGIDICLLETMEKVTKQTLVLLVDSYTKNCKPNPLIP